DCWAVLGLHDVVRAGLGWRELCHGAAVRERLLRYRAADHRGLLGAGESGRDVSGRPDAVLRAALPDLQPGQRSRVARGGRQRGAALLCLALRAAGRRAGAITLARAEPY